MSCTSFWYILHILLDSDVFGFLPRCLTRQPAKASTGCWGELWEGHAAWTIVSWRCSSSQMYDFLRESFRMNSRELLPCVSLLFVAPKVRTSCPRLMVRCAEDRLARGGEGRGSVLLTEHHVVQLRVLRPDSWAGNASMVQHFDGGIWYCGVLGSEDGAFSAKFSILAATALIDTNCNKSN